MSGAATWRPITAEAFLQGAQTVVSGPRADTHGPRVANMQVIETLQRALHEGAAVARTAGAKSPAPGVMTALDQVLVKMGRVLCGAFNPDDFVDMAGYAALAGQCAAEGHAAQTTIYAAGQDDGGAA